MHVVDQSICQKGEKLQNENFIASTWYRSYWILELEASIFNFDLRSKLPEKFWNTTNTGKFEWLWTLTLEVLLMNQHFSNKSSNQISRPK